MDEASRIELHPTTCSCRGGAWIVLAGASTAPCRGARAGDVPTQTLPLSEWKTLGKPATLEDYQQATARVQAGERREFHRFAVVLHVRLSRLPSWRSPNPQAEDTTTDVVALGGALVRSRMAVESGEILLFEVGSYRSRAEVRYVSGSAADGFLRLGVRFVDAPLPEALIPPDAVPVEGD
jgi:hypothetical protein